MKKLLKLLFVLSSSTTLPLTVIACGQESLDSNLNIIYIGDTKYNIDTILNIPIEKEMLESFSLSKSQTEEMTKKIVEIIFEKNSLDSIIPWYDETTEANQKCYNFIVKQENDKDKDKFIWNVDAITGRFTVKISYLVGSTDNQKNFVSHQKIDKSFKIKVAYSESDNIVENWINEFNNTIDWNQNPAQIDLSNLEVDLPTQGTSWSSLDEKIILKTNEVIAAKLNDFEIKLNSWLIKNTDKNLDAKMKLELQISVNLDEASALTKTFYIQLFKK